MLQPVLGRHPVAALRAARQVRWEHDRLFLATALVVAVQGGHCVEHVVQLLQVTVFAVPDDDALGLLGYLIQFNGTEEWLHLGYNTAYLIALWALVIPLRRLPPDVLPRRAFWFFLAASVWVETWHMVEHGVIIAHVIERGGCPCPGIGDSALGVSDTVLHFVYNMVAYSGLVLAFVFLMRSRRDLPRRA